MQEKQILEVKASGEQVPFSPKKLEQSLERAGADRPMIETIREELRPLLHDVIPRKEFTRITRCNPKKTEQQEQNQEAGAKMDSTTTIYACPMHPEVTGKEGDKCSKCGMKLEAVKAKDSTEMHHDH